MATLTRNSVLADMIGPSDGAGLRVKQAILVVVGIAAMTIAAQIKVAVPPSPVAVNLGTLAVLTIGAAYGARLGLVTIMAYMFIGALGFDVFQNSTATLNGWAYMSGSTGGYLVGYVLAIGVLGVLAAKGWDRSIWLMALAMLIGNVILYVPGLAWLSYWIESTGRLDTTTYGTLWGQTLQWGALPYLIGDAMKLAVAALVLPALWKIVGKAGG